MTQTPAVISKSFALDCDPGEKLYEELLIDAESHPTAHPLIYRAERTGPPPDKLWPQLGALETAIAAQNVDSALELLAFWCQNGSANLLYDCCLSKGLAQAVASFDLVFWTGLL